MSNDTTPADAPENSRWEGEVLDDTYLLETCIAQGGMGVVMLGRDLRMDREVAIKLIDPQIADDSRMRMRFEREIKISRSFSHPNIIQLFDYGETESGTLFMVMEYLKGRDLDSVLDHTRGGIGWERACHITLQILEALAEAHKHDIIHRDIKPANVFLTDRRRTREHVKLLDFGVAKSIGASKSVTGHRKVLGTPDYLAPELLFGESPSKSSDVYAVGLLFLEMILGRSIYSGDSAHQTLLLHIYEPIPMPTFLLSESPIGQVIRRGTLKHPGERYSSAQPMLEHLADALDQTRDDIEHGSHEISLVNTTRALADSSGVVDQTLPERMDLLKTVDPLPEVHDRWPADADTDEIEVGRTLASFRDTTSEISVPEGIASRAEQTAADMTRELRDVDPNESIGWREALSKPAIPIDESPTDEPNKQHASPSSLTLDEGLLDDVQNIFEEALSFPDDAPQSAAPETETRDGADTTDRLTDEVTVERQSRADPAERSYAPVDAANETSSEAETDYDREFTRGSGWTTAGVGLLVVVAGVGGTYMWWTSQTEGGTATRSGAATSSTSAKMDVAAAPSTAPDRVEVEFRSKPSGADIVRDGEVLGTTPATLTFDGDRRRVRVTVERPGYVPQTETVTLTEPRDPYVIELQREENDEARHETNLESRKRAVEKASQAVVSGAAQKAGRQASTKAEQQAAKKAEQQAAKKVEQQAAKTAEQQAAKKVEQQPPDPPTRQRRDQPRDSDQRTGESPPTAEQNSTADDESSYDGDLLPDLSDSPDETRDDSSKSSENDSEEPTDESGSYDDIAEEFVVD